ncbi:MAG TPA: hypothetical protein VMU78_06150 [Methylocella sp.]|nr:hypothetical protein [Methylocella sp.]
MAPEKSNNGFGGFLQGVEKTQFKKQMQGIARCRKMRPAILV